MGAETVAASEIGCMSYLAVITVSVIIASVATHIGEKHSHRGLTAGEIARTADYCEKSGRRYKIDYDKKTFEVIHMQCR